MKFIVGITTTPNRKEYLNNLLEQLKEEGINDIIVFNDEEYKGHLWNKKECLSKILQIAKEKVCIAIHFEDDVKLCKDFRQRLEKIIMENRDIRILSLFTKKHIVEKAQNGIAKGIFKRGYYEQGVVFLKELDYKYFEAYCQNFLKPKLAPNRYNHHDVRFQEFLVNRGESWGITIPTLIEHIGEKSTMKHKVGKSILFIDDIK